MNAGELKRRVGEIKPWFYEMDLGQGVKTPGLGSLPVLQARAEIYFRMGIEGRSVLDVGAWDGFYSFEAERRGAARVLAVDKFCWGGGGIGNRAAFDLAREALGSRVEDLVIDIPETTVDRVGPFDIVLFNGIVYHIKDPLRALADMARIARHVLSMETYMDLREVTRPAMVFYPGENAQPGYPQNGWGMNSPLGHALLRSLGFESVLEFPTPDVPDRRSIFLAFKPGHPYTEFVRSHQAFAKPRLMPAAPKPALQGTISASENTPGGDATTRPAPSLAGWRSIAQATRHRIAAYFH